MADPVFIYPPDYAAAAQSKPRLLTASYGDGYQQDIPDGINTNPQTWTVAFDRSRDDVEAIETFIEALQGASPFWWMNPRGNLIRCKCQQWTRNYQGWDEGVLQAQFQQIFDGTALTLITASELIIRG